MEKDFNAEKYIEDLRRLHGADTADKLVEYMDMVLERNEHINLTAIRDRDEALVKHLEDSLTVMNLPEFERASRIIDVGTGAGFPGALLAIACPEKEFVLLDSTLKKLRVIDEFASSLEITNIETVHARAEEAGALEYAAAFDLCLSRAVADLGKLAAYCLPFVKKGGSFIAYKGDSYQSELTAAAPQIRKYGGAFNRAAAVETDCKAISGHVLLVIDKVE